MRDEWGAGKGHGERSLRCHRGSPAPGGSSIIKAAPGAGASRELNQRQCLWAREAGGRPSGGDSGVFPDAGSLRGGTA